MKNFTLTLLALFIFSSITGQTFSTGTITFPSPLSEYSVKIDVTPMEGFVPAQYNEILGLDKLNLNAALVATVGYRHAEDDTQHYAKVRKSNEDLFLTL